MNDYPYPWQYESTFVSLQHTAPQYWTPINEHGFGGPWGSDGAGWQAQPAQLRSYEHSGYTHPGYNNTYFEQRAGFQDFRGPQYRQGRTGSTQWHQQPSSNFPTLYPSAPKEGEIVESQYFPGNQQYAPSRFQYQPHEEYVFYEAMQPQPWLTQQWRAADDVPPPPPPPQVPPRFPPQIPPSLPPPLTGDAFFRKLDVNSRPPRSAPQQEGFYSQRLDAKATKFVPQRSVIAGKSNRIFRIDKTDSSHHVKPSKPGQQSKRFLLPRPKPTSWYLKIANEVPVKMDAGRPLLVVLDLNGTVLYRKRSNGAFIPRPKVSKFLDYLFSNHFVFIWSSAKPHNVQAMCSNLLSTDQRQLLIAEWARDKLRIPPAHFDKNVQVYKQLSWIWDNNELKKANPDPAEPWMQHNTVLIDDSIEKAASEPYNAITLEEFEGREDQMKSDVLGQVVEYLEALRYERNVSAFIRRKPFVAESRELFDDEKGVIKEQSQSSENVERS